MICPPEIIETDRLILRKYNIEDGLNLYNFIKNNTEQLSKFKVLEDWVYKINKAEEAENYIKQLLAGWALRKIFTYAIVLKEQNLFIGEYKLFNIDWSKKFIEHGVFIAKQFEGKLLTFEIFRFIRKIIFEDMKFKKLYAKCHKDNNIAILGTKMTNGFRLEHEEDKMLCFSLSVEDYFMN